MDRHRSGQAGVGAVLIALGIVLMGSRLGWGARWDMGHLWPLMVIAAGIAHLVFSEDGRWRRGLIFIVGGTVFLLDRLDVLSLQMTWPLFIVGIGVGMLFRSWSCTPCRNPVARHGR